MDEGGSVGGKRKEEVQGWEVGGEVEIEWREAIWEGWKRERRFGEMRGGLGRLTRTMNSM